MRISCVLLLALFATFSVIAQDDDQIWSPDGEDDKPDFVEVDGTKEPETTEEPTTTTTVRPTTTVRLTTTVKPTTTTAQPTTTTAEPETPPPWEEWIEVGSKDTYPDDVDPREKIGSNIDDDYSGQSAFEEVAFAKPAMQTSTWGSYHADHAVNGLSDNDPEHSPCSCTTFEMHPMWWVDLKDVYDLNRVVIYAQWREEYKLREMVVETSYQGDVYNKCADIEDVYKPSMIYHRDCQGRARYVRIRSDSRKPHHLCLCSVKVFGRQKNGRWDARLVSEGMPTSMFPLLPGQWPYKAVDGGIHAKPWAKTSVEIRKNSKNFWQVNLQRVYAIDRVVIYFADNNTVHYLKVLTKRTENEGARACGYYYGNMRSQYVAQVECVVPPPSGGNAQPEPDGREGQFVQIVNAGDTDTQLTEVRVFGRPVTGKFSPLGHIISQGKRATASSFSRYINAPQKAFDHVGDPYESHNNGWQAGDNRDSNSIRVFLGRAYVVKLVNIQMGWKSGSNLQQLVVKTHVQRGSQEICYEESFENPPADGHMFQISCARIARTLTVTFVGSDVTVNEITVWGVGISTDYNRNYLISKDRPVEAATDEVLDVRDFLPSRLTDGRTQSYFAGRTCFITKKGNRPYVRILLQEKYLISGVVVHFMEEQGTNYVDELVVSAKMADSDTSKVCAKYSQRVANGAVLNLDIREDANCVGNVLKIEATQPLSAALKLCEVQVYGRLA